MTLLWIALLSLSCLAGAVMAEEKKAAKLGAPVIVAGVIGGVIGLSAVLILICLYMPKNKRTKAEAAAASELELGEQQAYGERTPGSDSPPYDKASYVTHEVPTLGRDPSNQTSAQK